MDFKTGAKLAGIAALAVVPTAVSFGVYGAMKDRNKGNVASGLAASASGLGAGIAIGIASLLLGVWELPAEMQTGVSGLGLLNVQKSMGLLNVQKSKMGLLNVSRKGMGVVNVQRMRGCASC